MTTSTSPRHAAPAAAIALPGPGSRARPLAPVRVVLTTLAATSDPIEEEVELTLHHPGATAADLALALSGGERAAASALARRRWHGADAAIVVDGRPIPPGLPLRASGLRRGSTVACAAGGVHETARDGLPARSGWRLRLVAGPDAGRELPLALGPQVLGRGRSADLAVEDPALARRQAIVEVDVDGGAVVTLTDLGERRPGRVDGVVLTGDQVMAPGETLRVGATSAVLVRDALDGGDGLAGAGEEVAEAGISGGRRAAEPPPAVAGPRWTVAVHRPPPVAPLAPPRPVTVPEGASARQAPASVGLASVAATLVAGGVVAVVLRQPTFLLLSAVGAVGSVGAAVWYRGRGRMRWQRDQRRAEAEHRRFAEQLADHQREAAEWRRATALELPAAVTLARSGGPGLWSRRSADAGAYRAVVGRGEQVVPPILGGGADGLADPPVPCDLWSLVEAASVVPDVPVTVDLGPGAVVGIVGPPVATRALMRSLVLQLAVAHGPADLLLAGLAAVGETTDEGSWLAWLPHTEDLSGERLVAAGPAVDVVLGGLEHPPSGGVPHLLLVAEDPSLLNARNTAARRVLAGERPVAALVLAEEAAALPSVCGTVVTVRADGTASIQRSGGGDLAGHVVMAGASLATAREVARALASFHDPERPPGAGGLPATVSLLDLLPVAVDQPDQLQAYWRAAGDDPPLRTRLAQAADGPVEIDLVRDGPHVLVAGTTGSGKSDLLRSLVAGLAAGTPPEQLAFVLVDYKGGAAFDACARLPHVVGMVTDLDDRLAERALRSLHAELRRREAVLRAAGAADLTAYRSVPARPPLPRLVVVVDEFATLAADLPGFVPSLVAVAQRGRSLGVHLVLATQRPAGAVSDEIRANTNLRIALRVQDPADALDVVGDAAPAGIPRHRPGRAVIRFGPGELVPVQVASPSAPVPAAVGQAVSVSTGVEVAGAGPAALEVLVASIERAADVAGSVAAAVSPWLPPLPGDVALQSLPAGAAGLLDDPDQQAQRPWSWDRGRGHALCVGTVGSGASTALAALAFGAAATASPSELHLYVIGDEPILRALEHLPHTGAVISPGEDERLARLLRRLGRQVEAGDGSGGPSWPAEQESAERRPEVILLVDRLASLRLDVAARLGPGLADLLDRLLVEGPAGGIVVAGGLDRPGALPLAVSGAVGERLVLRLADPADAPAAGVRPSQVAGSPPGRAWLAVEDREIQIGRPGDPVLLARQVAARWDDADPRGRPAPIERLPTCVAAGALPVGSAPPGGPCAVAVGLDGDTLDPAWLTLHPGDHLLVAGPARSGRTTALALLGRRIALADPRAQVVALVPRPQRAAALGSFSPCSTLDGLAGQVAVADPDRPLVVLVDDAELIEDRGEVLASLLAGPANVLVAGRVDAVRSAYGHWTQVVRRQRRGVLLRTESDLDGDVLGVTLPRWSAVPAAVGRGYLVADGRLTLVQLAADLPSGTAGD